MNKVLRLVGEREQCKQVTLSRREDGLPAMSEIGVGALCALAWAGCLYVLLAVLAARRIMAREPALAQRAVSVTLLKPLHGLEPGLLANIGSFVTQDYAGPVSIVFGVADPEDPAVAVVQALREAHPEAAIKLVVDGRQHGANRKISNLINMDAGEGGDIVVLADSDIRVERDYLARLVGALEAPGTGAVSCLYRGRPEPGSWAALSALGIDTGFLPNAALGIVFGLAKPCFGSTIALRRETLARIGGFEPLGDQLADDYALGAAVRASGLSVAFPPMLVDHICVDEGFAQLWRHELRWARTIRLLNPAGHCGSIVTHPMPLALLATVISGFSPLAVWTLVASLACRAVAYRVWRTIFGLHRVPFWLLPVRDCVSFAVFVWSFAGRSVQWKGRRYDVAGDGAIRRDEDEGARRG